MDIPGFYRLLTIFRPYIYSLFNLDYYSIVDLQGRTGINGEKIYIDSYYANGLYPTSQKGGWRLVFKSTQAKSGHNGITVHSPTVPWTGTQATLSAYQSKTGETDPTGSGCWVLERDDYTVEMAGAVGDKTVDDTPVFQALATMLGNSGGGIFRFTGQYLIDTNLSIPDFVAGQGNFHLGDELKPVATADYDGKNSLLVINSAATITLNDGAGISHFLAIRKGLDLPFADAAAATTGVAAFAGTAITGGGQGFYAHHIMALGFQYAVDSINFARVRLEYIIGDCTNGIRVQNDLDVSHINFCHFWPYTTVHNTWVTDALLTRTGTAYEFSNTADWCKFTKCFSFGYATGFKADSVNSVTYDQCSADYPGALSSTSIGFDISGTTRKATFISPQAAAQGTGIKVNTTLDTEIQVMIISPKIWSCDSKAIDVVGGRVSITGGGSIVSCPIGVDIGSACGGVIMNDAIDFTSVTTPIQGSGVGYLKSTIGKHNFKSCGDSTVGVRQCFDNSNLCDNNIKVYHGTGQGYEIIGNVSRGTVDAPSAAVNGDQAFVVTAKGSDALTSDGTEFRSMAKWRMISEGTVTNTSSPGRHVWSTTPSGSTTLVDALVLDSSGNLIPATNNTFQLGNGSFRWSNILTTNINVSGVISSTAPVTKTADFSVGITENYLINNKAGSACTVTLPSAATWTGRTIIIKNLQAQTVDSASSNVCPIDSTTAGTAILAATAGKYAKLVSDGTNWVIMEAN